MPNIFLSSFLPLVVASYSNLIQIDRESSIGLLLLSLFIQSIFRIDMTIMSWDSSSSCGCFSINHLSKLMQGLSWPSFFFRFHLLSNANAKLIKILSWYPSSYYCYFLFNFSEQVQQTLLLAPCGNFPFNSYSKLIQNHWKYPPHRETSPPPGNVPPHRETSLPPGNVAQFINRLVDL